MVLFRQAIPLTIINDESQLAAQMLHQEDFFWVIIWVNSPA